MSSRPPSAALSNSDSSHQSRINCIISVRTSIPIPHQPQGEAMARNAPSSHATDAPAKMGSDERGGAKSRSDKGAQNVSLSCKENMQGRG
jgi:hypothetical protein